MVYEKLLEKANAELKKVVDFINENDEMFDMMDLKLHDISYYCWKDMEKDFPLTYAENKNIFYDFCDYAYEWFKMWCEDNYIDFDGMIEHVGRTSKFYLHKWHDKNIDYMLYTIIEKIGLWYATSYFNIEDGVIISTDYEDFADETLESLEYIAEEFYDDFMKATEDMVKVYDYIKDFKDSQVEYFKEYCNCEEPYFQYLIDESKRLDEESKNIILGIQNKYNITDEDMKTLKENL